MQFTYFYKTSDGVRHKAEISAPTRDEAFSALRKEGIRPIKLFASEDQPRQYEWKRWAAIGVLGLAVASLTTYVLTRPAAVTRRERTPSASDPGRSGTIESPIIAVSSAPAYSNLSEQVQGLVKQRAKSLQGLELDMLKNYALIENLQDISRLTEEIDKARRIIEASRAQTKELFRTAYGELPSGDIATRMATQQLYDRTVRNIDGDEAELDAAEFALLLLDDNRSKWKSHKGKIVFDDPQLEREFNLISTQTDAAAVRWRKEFGSGK